MKQPTILNKLLAQELQFPPVGSLHDCLACGEPQIARFLGARNGKGQWQWLREHRCVRGMIVPATQSERKGGETE